MPSVQAAGSAASAHREPAQVELILSQIETLPTLSAVATRLFELANDEKAGVRDAAQLVASDQSLSARLLSRVRKADIGGSADTVQQAVALLGLDLVRNLALSIQVFETFSPGAQDSASRFDRVGFWKHSLSVGCAARLLAELQAKNNPAFAAKPEEAFVCGLMHDIGKVVFDACFPKSYDRVIEQVDAVNGCIAEIERQVFGLDHAQAGRRLCRHWKLPEMISECIWLHHHWPGSTPDSIKYPDHVRLVQVADRLVRQMHLGYSGNYQIDGGLSKLAGQIGLSDKDVASVASSLPELIEKRAELLGLEEFSSKEIMAETLTNANLQLSRVNDALSASNRRLEQRSLCFDAFGVLNEGLTEEPTHEEVVRSAVKAVQILQGSGSLAVFTQSANRSLAILGGLADKDSDVAVELLPASTMEDLDQLSSPGSAWLPASVIPKALGDRLSNMLGRPPAKCWPIRHQSVFVGAIVVPEGVSTDVNEGFELLSRWVGLWLSTAESRSVTRQLTEELAEINCRLINSQDEVARICSLGMVGQMAAGAAHEINGPLAVISGRAQLLGSDSQDEKTRRSAELISEQAHRASGIVNELMEFAKPTPPQPTEWSIGTLLGEIRQRWTQESVIEEKQFHIELSDDLPDVRADYSQMQMLFDELIRNAVDAMRDVADPLLVVNCRADVADERIVARIQDNGCGMPPEVLINAMDPFFSHRPAGRGRGLGLSRAARYAEINGGRIRLSSEAEKGTTVIIELPIARHS